MIFIDDFEEASGRIMAAKSEDQMKLDDLKTMQRHFNNLIARAEKREGAEARRAAKLQAAANDPRMEPMVRYAKGALRRIGLDFIAAADFSKLDKAIRESTLDSAQRIELRSVLFELGVID